MLPGKLKRPDNEYKRCGTANAFCAVEPKAGTHFTLVTPNRSAPQFAETLETIIVSYPEADTIHLIMDNLNIHGPKSLTDYFGKEKGEQLWSRLTVHYTPKHGSWLNQAEIEIGLFARQCLAKTVSLVTADTSTTLPGVQPAHGEDEAVVEMWLHGTVTPASSPSGTRRPVSSQSPDS